MAGRSYADAVAALNTLQTNFAIVDSIRKSRKSMNKNAISEMIEWCRRIGYEPSDLDRLNAIHIAGTKGKGSTSAFISSILGQYRFSSTSKPETPLLHKIGLYTSPHLRFVRERIQINNQPLSEQAFAKYFFETWDRLEEAAKAKGEPTDTTAKPGYFRFLTLMAYHTYMSESVDTAVIECGIGGEYDSTNILVKPTVTGITSLGIDHTVILGNTIEEIAWHKGGIMKAGAPCFTAPQPPAALEVLQKRADEVPTKLHVVDRNPALYDIKLGLAADFQKTNASLAVAIADAHLMALGHQDRKRQNELPSEFIRGLEEVRWPGRCETRREENIAWHIDGGHTLESIEVAGSWFASQIPPSSSSTSPKIKRKRILLFNQQTRDANALAKALHRTLVSLLHDEQPFTHAVFCTNITFQEEGYRPDLMSMNTSSAAVERLDVQRGLAETWRDVDPEAVVEVKGSIEEAVGWCRDIAEAEKRNGKEEVMVLVTGSVHLVGGFLEVLETGKD
ncbi:MAG: Folylpolyglutamate synthetase [Alectoria sarmentosa]|nr:MAG: Folylpolyglutamate synthetase [Alectoria sarmentosa]